MFDLKSFRIEKKLKQSDLASLFNCQQSNISMLEKTKRDLTDIQLNILIENFGEEYVMKYYTPNNTCITDSYNELNGVSSIGGHAINITGNSRLEKIITGENQKIAQKCAVVLNENLQEIDSLKREVAILKAELNSKEQIISSLKGEINAKDITISLLHDSNESLKQIVNHKQSK